MPRPSTTIVAAACVLTAGALFAGPLNPPPGSIAATNKTLAEIEPRTAISAANTPGLANAMFTITQPGSYYLTGNITAQPGMVGIFVQANNVTIDLRGFALLGNGVGDDAIGCGGGFADITIRSGSIRGWVKEGIDAYNCTNVTVEGVSVVGSTNGYGIIATENARFLRCTVTNSAAGFIAGNYSSAEDCLSRSNATVGFQFGVGARLSRCTAAATTGGAPSYIAGADSIISECIARECSGDGFRVGAGGRVTRCTAQRATFGSIGFDVSDSTLLTDSASTNFNTGVKLSGSYDRVERCQVVAFGAAIDGTQAVGGFTPGFHHVAGNSVNGGNDPFAHSIAVSYGSRVEDNTIYHLGTSNTGGIATTMLNNAVQRNLFYLAGTGIPSSVRLGPSSPGNVVTQNIHTFNAVDLAGQSWIAPMGTPTGGSTHPWFNY